MKHLKFILIIVLTAVLPCFVQAGCPTCPDSADTEGWNQIAKTTYSNCMKQIVSGQLKDFGFTDCTQVSCGKAYCRKQVAEIVGDPSITGSNVRKDTRNKRDQ